MFVGESTTPDLGTVVNEDLNLQDFRAAYDAVSRCEDPERPEVAK